MQAAAMLLFLAAAHGLLLHRCEQRLCLLLERDKHATLTFDIELPMSLPKLLMGCTATKRTATYSNAAGFLSLAHDVLRAPARRLDAATA